MSSSTVTNAPPGQRNPTLGLIYAVAGAAVVSTNFITGKYGLGGKDVSAGFNSGTFSLVWCTAAAVYCFIACASRGRRNLALPLRLVLPMVLLGAFTGIGMLVGWEGLKLLNESFASFLYRFGPVFAILVGAIVLKEKLSALEIVCLMIMVAGGCLATIGQWKVVGTGVVLVMLSCAAAAVQHLIAKVYSRAIGTSTLVFYRASIGALTVALWLMVRGGADFDVPARYWAVTLLGALLGPCIGYLLTWRAFRYWDLARSGIVWTAQPLFVLPMAWLAFGRLAQPQELAGGAVILAGAAVLAWVHLRHATRGPVPQPGDISTGE